MEKYYFTFCGFHNTPNGYVEIIAQNYGWARELMFEEYGDAWGFQYTEKEFEGQAEKFGLYKIQTIAEYRSL